MKMRYAMWDSESDNIMKNGDYWRIKNVIWPRINGGRRKKGEKWKALCYVYGWCAAFIHFWYNLKILFSFFRSSRESVFRFFKILGFSAPRKGEGNFHACRPWWIIFFLSKIQLTEHSSSGVNGDFPSLSYPLFYILLVRFCVYWWFW